MECILIKTISNKQIKQKFSPSKCSGSPNKATEKRYSRDFSNIQPNYFTYNPTQVYKSVWFTHL